MSQAFFSSHRQFKLRLRWRIEQFQVLRRGLHIDSQSPLSPHAIPQTVAHDISQPPPKSKSLYIDSPPPTTIQILAATQFFRNLPPRIAWVANEWRKTNTHNPQSTSTSTTSSTTTLLTPEIAFLGRSNSGKSSLLNALLMKPSLCRVGAKPGKTTTMHAWALSPSDPHTHGARKGSKGDVTSKLIVLDMPGYGHGSRDEWGNEITRYLRSRRQLKRAFVLINAEHGVKKSDEMILGLLRREGISHQIVASKCDGVKKSQLEGSLEGIRGQILEGQRRDGGMGVALDDILAVGALGDGGMNRRVKETKMVGIEEVRWAVLRAAGLEDYAFSKLREKQQKVNMQRMANGLRPLPLVTDEVDGIDGGGSRSQNVLTDTV